MLSHLASIIKYTVYLNVSVISQAPVISSSEYVYIHFDLFFELL